MTANSRHQCLIYSDAPSVQIPIIGRQLIERLKSGYRCAYMNSSAMVSGLRSFLAAEGIDIKQRTDSGSLILSSDESHLVDGQFDTDRMIGNLRNEALRSQADGFVGIWVSGDMTWEFGNEKNLSKLLDYERKLDQLFYEVPALNGICQYHMDTLPADCIIDALHTHPAVCINESLSRVNPHYVSPKSQGHGRPSVTDTQLQRMLKGLGIRPYPLKISETCE